MTRDEAIHRITATTPAYSGASSMWLVDSLAILGLLKFNEPKSNMSEDVLLALRSCFRGRPVVSAFQIFDALDAAGFTIVEKD